MTENVTLSAPRQSEPTLRALMPLIESRFKGQLPQPEWEVYTCRLKRHFPRLFARLLALYQDRDDLVPHLEQILTTATKYWLARPAELKALDALREDDPRWYESNRMVGAMCYVDLFAGNIGKLRERIPYLCELGITYLHLMPLFKAPRAYNDGGYAVTSGRELNPAIGTMEQLSDLATELRHYGISLCLDFVINHTSDEHEWARRAQSGDPEYQAYYYMFSGRDMPDLYERHVRPVFPHESPGSFTYDSKSGKWVWTTFHSCQWDLNYRNPAVFDSMLEDMLFLANQGVEVLRFDALAFVWKQLGTDCLNLPENHDLIEAFNAAVSIVAPATLFKAEAVVHPDEVRKYVGAEQCQLAYNAQLMALLWQALAAQDVRALERGMRQRFKLPQGCTWINYIRCHDDICWAISDEDLEALGLEAAEHRHFLTRFYTGQLGSFACGAPFEGDASIGDARVSGTCASLVGLQKALADGDEREIELAIRRILLLYGIVVTIGGIPVIYLGDEIGLLNDPAYWQDPAKADDSRWLHRPAFDWELAQKRCDRSSVPGRIYHGLLRLIRTQNPALTTGETEFLETDNRHVFGYCRRQDGRRVFVLANFSERQQRLDAPRLRRLDMPELAVDLYAGHTVTAQQGIVMEPYQLMVLSSVRSPVCR